MILGASAFNIATVPPGTTLAGLRPLLRLPLLGLLLVASPVRGQDGTHTPYDPRSHRWDGLGHLVGLAAEEGLALGVPDRIDPADLDGRDAVLVVAPAGRLPVTALLEFVRRGGRLLVADDTGEARALFDTFGIAFDPAPEPTGPTLRDRPDWPLALPRPGAWHPLLDGVDAVVTNRPAAIGHERVRPLLVLGPCRDGGSCGERGLLLVGVVGAGRFVALSDPSVLIDNMLRFRGNERLARNLLRYLDAERGGRIWLAPPTTTWVLPEEGPEAPDDPLERLRRALASLVGRPAPPWLLRGASAALLVLLALLGLGRARRHDPYRPTALLGPELPAGGAAGRVAFHLEHPGSLAVALETWHRAVLWTLAERLGPSVSPDPRSVVAVLRARDPALAAEAAAFFRDVEGTVRRAERAPAHPVVHRNELVRLVERGRRLLDAPPESRPCSEQEHPPHGGPVR